MGLILASSSKYRQNLLQRLGVTFNAQKPLIDEDKHKDPKLGPLELAERLAELKAKSLFDNMNFILGGDQLVHFEGTILGKPGTKENAIKQLQTLSGKTHELITSICLLTPANKSLIYTDKTKITFKKLSNQWIQHVVEVDQPLDCAGAYKFESLGISMVEKLECQDPTAIEGLPLIELSRMLKECGLQNF